MNSSSIARQALQKPVGCARADRQRTVHGRARHVDRERRARVDQVQPRLFAGQPPVGDHRLRDHLRRLPAARRAPGRHSRSPARLHDGDRGLHARLGAERSRVVRDLSRRLPRPPGRGRRALRARRPFAADDGLPRRTRAQRRPRRLGRSIRQRCRRRRAARRRLDLLPELAVDLLHQRARRSCSRSRWSRASSPRARGDARLASLRRGRRDHDHRGAHAPRLRADTGDAGRLGDADDRDAAGRVRSARDRVRRHRAACRIAAAAVPGLPRQHARHRERDHVHHRGDRVLAVLPLDAVPAAGAPLLRSRERARVRRDRRHGRAHVECRAAARHALRSPPRARRRPPLDGAAAGPARAAAGPRELRDRPAAVVHPRRPRAGRLVRRGDDRGSRRSAAGKRGHRIRSRQHEPPDRRGARPRRDHDGRDDLHDPRRPRTSRQRRAPHTGSAWRSAC